MGYSITAPCKSEKAKEEMLAFLNKHYRSPATFIDGIEEDGLRGPLGDDFSYSHGECEIGFDYTSWAPARAFAFAMCRWIALRVGPKKEMEVFEGDGRLVATMPYYVYDGFDEIPIRLADKWYDKANDKQMNWSFFDEHGWDVKLEGLALDMLRLQGDDVCEKFHCELKRLSELWEKEH